MNDLISVIIPVYNSDKYLKNCLDSVLNQTYLNLEVIIINDGSKDQSDSICRKYVNEHENIRYIYQENRGVSEARNRGVSIAAGKYIAFVDSDDMVPQNYFEVLYENMVSQRVDLSIVAVDAFWKDNNKDKKIVIDFKTDYSEKFLELNKTFLLYGPCAKLYLKDIILENRINFPRELSYGEDLVFNCRYLKYCNKIFFDSSVKYFYRKDNGESLSRKIRENRFENELILCEQLRTLFFDKKVYDAEYAQYLDERIFDEGYNRIFDILNNSLPIREKISMISEITKHEKFKNALKNIPANKYSKYILWFLKKDYLMLLMAYYALRK